MLQISLSHHSHLLNIYLHTLGCRLPIFPSQNSLFPYLPTATLSWFSCLGSSSIFSLSGSSSVLLLHISTPQESVPEPLFCLSCYPFKNNLMNFHAFKYYHYADRLRFVSAAQTSPLKSKLKHQTTYLNLCWLSCRLSPIYG